MPGRSTIPVALSPTDLVSSAEDESNRQFRALLDRRDVRVLFQPMVDLQSGEIVALEALARGPVGTEFESPLALFAAARRVNRVAELDWVCRAAAFTAFLDAGLPPAMSLFVNVEPEAIAAVCPADLTGVVARAESKLRVFVEINDRALAADPARVLAAVDRARTMGWGIAIDDVGSSRAPIAMLPIVLADVVKLDLRRLERVSVLDSSAIITAVLRHVEKTGATLLVEGIETEADARWAGALGAHYGQGLHLGIPGPLRESYPFPRYPVRLTSTVSRHLDIESPFELFTENAIAKMGRHDLDKLALTLAYSPRTTGTWPVFLAGVGRDGRIPPLMIDHGAPEESLLFVTFGTDLRNEPAPGVRGVRLALDDPLADERFLIVLSDQAPIAIFSRPSLEGMFDVVVTQDRGVVHDIAHHLIRRIPGPGRNNYALSSSPRVFDDDEPTHVPPAAHKNSWLGRRGRKS